MDLKFNTMEENKQGTSSKLNTEGIDMTKVDLEEQAIDIEAYQKWRKMIELPQLKNREWLHSDGVTTIKIGTPVGTFQKMIAHLPEEDIEKLMKKKALYTDLLMKANLLKNKAFGLTRQKKGLPNRIMMLLEAKRLEMIELFGRMFSVKEVHEVCVNTWEIPVGLEPIIKFRQEYGNIIEDKIKEHRTGWADIRLGVKRSRLEEYCWIYQQSKNKYNSLGSREDLKVMIAVLDKIKGETEADQLNINVNGKIDLEVNLSQHVQKEVLGGLGLRQLIIGRVASRMGTSPSFLISRLTSSYYAKFAVGDESEIEDIPYEEVKYPTKEPYDFDNIKKLNEGIMKSTEENLTKERIKAYQHAENVKQLGVKAALLGMIQSEASKVKAVKSAADAAELNRDLEESGKLSTKDKLKAMMKK